MSENTLRSLSVGELRLLDFLLDVDFPGRQELRKQVPTAKVRVIDENGSLGFVVVDPARASVKESVPVQARLPDSKGEDSFGICVNLLLHVRQGVLFELEIYKDDGSPIASPLRFEKAFVWAI